MRTTTSNQELGRQIEQLVRDYIAASRTEAAAAVQRAFASASPERVQARQSRKPATASARRSPEDVAALSERLYRAVCAKPGEAMTVLAADVGETPRALQIAATRLRRTGRIRSVGQRQHTRYFPMVTDASRSA